MKGTTILPQGYKKTSVGIIPEDWDVKRLGDICYSISSGKNKIKNSTGRYPVYGSTGVIGYTNKFVYDDSFILVARVGANAGFLNKCTGKMDISDNTLIIKLKEGQNLLYVFNKLKYKNLNRLVFGSGQPLITSSLLKGFKIAYPPLPEQQNIAEILSLWDKAFEKQSQLISQLELRKKGLMQQLLTGKKRLPGFEGEWKKHQLKELFIERNETRCNNLPLLSITADKGVIYQSESDKKDTSNEDKSKYKRICPNDIGYNTMRMWQGRSALSSLEGIVSPAYTIVVPSKEVDASFMSMLLKQPRTIYDFWTHSQGLVDDTLNCKFHNFAEVFVKIPTLKEQISITNVLKQADIEIESQQKKLEHIHSQKRGLMQQLLTGKIRVK